MDGMKAIDCRPSAAQKRQREHDLERRTVLLELRNFPVGKRQRRVSNSALPTSRSSPPPRRPAPGLGTTAPPAHRDGRCDPDQDR